MKHIVLTNDDGIDAKGIQTLRQCLEPSFRVTVVAPDQERSASGHAITMRKPLYASRETYASGNVGWRITGTPADCVKLAMEALLVDEPPDCLISGINMGSNLGRDVFYSGTVSAAMEGTFLGVPAIAVSLANPTVPGLRWAGEFIHWWIRSPHFRLPGSGILYNVNFPDLSQGTPTAMVVARLGRRAYDNEFHRKVDPRGDVFYWLAGTPRDEGEAPDTDVAQVRAGLITFTPLRMEDVTALDAMGDWQRLLVPPTF